MRPATVVSSANRSRLEGVQCVQRWAGDVRGQSSIRSERHQYRPADAAISLPAFIAEFEFVVAIRIQQLAHEKCFNPAQNKFPKRK